MGDVADGEVAFSDETVGGVTVNEVAVSGGSMGLLLWQSALWQSAKWQPAVYLLSLFCQRCSHMFVGVKF
jgi:hypothetical protein